MATTEPRGRVSRLFHSRLFLIGGAIIVMTIALANARVYYQSYKIKQEIASMQREIDDLNQKKLESMEVLKYVMSQHFVEDKARTELDMKKPGEEVAIITPTDRIAESTTTSAIASRQDIPNPLKWWYYFTHRSL